MDANRLYVVVVGGFACALSLWFSQPVLDAAQGRFTPACDPASELCLLSQAPWMTPQALMYRGPAGANDLRLEWAQGAKNGEIDRIDLVADDATTNTWQAILPPDLQPADELSLKATTQGTSLELLTSGAVRRRALEPRLRISRHGKQGIAELRVKHRGAVLARIKLRLVASYPAEKSQTAKTWSLKKVLSVPEHDDVKLLTDSVVKRCKKYAKCRLVATASVSAFGYRLATDRAKDSVPTPPERPTGNPAFVPGEMRSGGHGLLYRYAVYVEGGVKIDRQDFAKQVGDTLGDPRGWTRNGRVSFEQVSDPQKANTRLILASPPLVDRLCAPLQTNGFSSCRQGDNVVLNLDRWRYKVPFIKSRVRYRHYLVNHEMGHRIGHGHRSCPRPGATAPVMEPQTGGLEGCRANGWPLDYEVAATPQRAAQAAAGGTPQAIPSPGGTAFWFD